MSQMKTNDREEIERLLSMGFSITEIAKRLKRSKSTIIREIITRAIECNHNYKCSNRICVNYESCQRIKGYGYTPKNHSEIHLIVLMYVQTLLKESATNSLLYHMFVMDVENSTIVL